MECGPNEDLFVIEVTFIFLMVRVGHKVMSFILTTKPRSHQRFGRGVFWEGTSPGRGSYGGSP